MKYLFLILLFLICVSCKKERSIHIIAKNPVTGARYAGLTYYVVEHRTAGGGEKSKTIATGSLNENGEVALSLKISKNYSYGVRVVEPANTCYNKQISQSFGSQYDVDGTFTFEFAECGNLQRKVTNTSCFDSNDKIEIYIDNSVHSLLSAPWILNGCADYTTVPTQVPIGIYTLHWIVTKNGIETEYSDSFEINENESEFYEINY